MRQGKLSAAPAGRQAMAKRDSEKWKDAAGGMPADKLLDIIRKEPVRRKRRVKMIKRLSAAAGATVLILNIWRDHEEAIFRKR